MTFDKSHLKLIRQSMQDALDHGAQRIGHGVRIIEDIDTETGQFGKIAEYILENKIPLEICITSNIHTGMYPSAEEHPIGKLIDFGFEVSLNTDNRLMSNTTITKEKHAAEKSGVSNVEQLLVNSASYSFLN